MTQEFTNQTPTFSSNVQNYKQGALRVGFRKNNLWKIGFFILLFFLFTLIGGFAYYSRKLAGLESGKEGYLAQPTPTVFSSFPTKVASSPTPSLVKKAVPSDWISQKSKLCGVNFWIPPDTDKYSRPPDPIEGSPPVNKEAKYKWIFEEWDQSGDELFPLISRVLYRLREGPSDSLGYISVDCALNSRGYNTETLLMKIKEEVRAGRFGFITAIKNQRRIEIWNRAVYALEFEYSEDAMDIGRPRPYYIFATTSHILFIDKESFSENENFKEIVEAIFESLQFEE